MRIGVPKEIKVHEYRVGLVPAAVRELVDAGHQVRVQTGSASGIGFSDADYLRVGAKIAASAEDVFAESELIVKVKEPQPQECARLRKDQVLFTYLHLAADKAQAEALQKSGATCIAYETVTAPDGSLPLLTPMSEVAGRMSVQVGAYCLQKANGGRGVLLGGVPGVAPAKVVVLGGGVAGTHAVEMAVGLRADVTVVDRSMKRLRELSALFGPALRTEYSTQDQVEALVIEADLVIVAVLTGTPAVFVHPGEAAHGDLGVVGPGDCLFAFSTSGKTREVVEMVEMSRHLGPHKVIAVTSHPQSDLRLVSDIIIDMGQIAEPCSLGLTPTASIAVMSAIADALALIVMERRGFTRKDYGLRHHGGYLGAKARLDNV